MRVYPSAHTHGNHGSIHIILSAGQSQGINSQLIPFTVKFSLHEQLVCVMLLMVTSVQVALGWQGW